MDTATRKTQGALWWGLACLAGGLLLTVLGFALASTAAGDNPVLLLIGPLLVLAGLVLLVVGAIGRARGH